jgi:hypothetical protein
MDGIQNDEIRILGDEEAVMHREEGKQLKWYGCIMEMQEMDGQKAYII